MEHHHTCPLRQAVSRFDLSFQSFGLLVASRLNLISLFMTKVLVIANDLSIHLFHFNSDLHYLSPEDDGPDANQQERH